MEEATSETHTEKIRKTVSFTHKQLGLGGGIIAAIMMLDPLKSWFFTREEGAALDRNVVRIERIVDENKKEILLNLTSSQAEIARVIERKVDDVVELLRAQEERATREAQRQERRIENLEFIVLTKPKTKGE